MLANFCHSSPCILPIILKEKRPLKQQCVYFEVFYLEVIKVDIRLPKIVNELHVNIDLVVIGRDVDAVVEPGEGEEDVDVDGEVAVLHPVDVDQQQRIADLERISARVRLGHVHCVVRIGKADLYQIR